MANVLEVINVHRIYESAAGYTHALRGVSLQVSRGEFLCVMGPSGSGKSTLMNILGGLDRPTSGTYKLEGDKINVLFDDDTQSQFEVKKSGDSEFIIVTYNEYDVTFTRQ